MNDRAELLKERAITCLKSAAFQIHLLPDNYDEIEEDVEIDNPTFDKAAGLLDTAEQYIDQLIEETKLNV